MIGRISGKLIEKHPPQILIDVNGIGYEIDVSMQTYCQLPAIGETLTLHTRLHIREDSHTLFGFTTAAERSTFGQLMKVNGIGAKTALGVLSAMNSEELAQAIAQEDIKHLASVPGIGKKTAERLILELRGKLTTQTPPDTGLFAAAAGQTDDIIHTLLALGYNEREAQRAVKGIPPGTEVGEGVRQALKNLLK